MSLRISIGIFTSSQPSHHVHSFISQYPIAASSAQQSCAPDADAALLLYELQWRLAPNPLGMHSPCRDKTLQDLKKHRTCTIVRVKHCTSSLQLLRENTCEASAFHHFYAWIGCVPTLDKLGEKPSQLLMAIFPILQDRQRQRQKQQQQQRQQSRAITQTQLGSDSSSVTASHRLRKIQKADERVLKTRGGTFGAFCTYVRVSWRATRAADIS